MRPVRFGSGPGVAIRVRFGPGCIASRVGSDSGVKKKAGSVSGAKSCTRAALYTTDAHMRCTCLKTREGITNFVFHYFAFQKESRPDKVK